MKQDVKNLLFDLGGVILNIDYYRPVEEFEKLGATDFEEAFSQSSQAAFFDHFERGDITPAEFRKHIRKYLPEKVTDAEIDNAWCSILGDLPSTRIVQLKLLKNQGYRLFLLSNTNSIHIKAFTRYLDDTYGKHLFKDLFEKVYYSSQIGMRKPSKKVFDFVLKENNLKAGETLFIDDSIQHIEGAAKAGLQTHWLQEPQTINDLFQDIPMASPDKVQ